MLFKTKKKPCLIQQQKFLFSFLNKTVFCYSALNIYFVQIVFLKRNNLRKIQLYFTNQRVQPSSKIITKVFESLKLKIKNN